MLEDFVSRLVPAQDRLWSKAAQCIESIEQAELRFGDHVSKATIHTWLAWQQEPGKPMGLAITKGYLDGTVRPAIHFVEWFRRLVNTARVDNPPIE